jgi:hypothetical protein
VKPRIVTPGGLGVLRGLLATARFQSDGLEAFGEGVQHILGSLAPLLAMPVVILLLMLVSGRLGEVADVLSLVDALLMQMVVSEALARRWGREREWGRYATAINWCQWAVPPVGILLAVALPVLMGFGADPAVAATIWVLALAAYALTLQWFVARHALRLGIGRAVVMVVAVNAATAAVVILPTQLRLVFEGPA